MKVLHISTATSWRGGEQQICNLVRGLNQLGVESHLWYPLDAPIGDRFEGATLRPYKKRMALDPISSYKIVRYCKFHGVDLIHAHDAHAHNLVWLASSMFSIDLPIIVNRRVDFPIKKGSYMKYNAKGISAYICVSHAVKKVLYPMIKQKEKLHVVHSAIDVARLMSNTKQDYLRTRFGIPKSYKIVGNVAAIADHKDYPTFLATAKILKENYPGKIKFLAIGGDGGLMTKMKQLSESLGLMNDVIFTGYIKHVKSYISELDVLLFTSKMEALGTSILDVMASKVPIVATRAGGIPEMITHEKNGLLANVGDVETLADSVIKVLKQPSFSSQITDQAIQDVKAFDYREMAKKVLDIYNRV